GKSPPEHWSVRLEGLPPDQLHSGYNRPEPGSVQEERKPRNAYQTPLSCRALLQPSAIILSPPASDQPHHQRKDHQQTNHHAGTGQQEQVTGRSRAALAQAFYLGGRGLPVRVAIGLHQVVAQG